MLMEMDFVKGYVVEGAIILESEPVEVILEGGEMVKGYLLKPSKKEFRLAISEELVRVIKVEDVVEIKKQNGGII